MKLSPIVCASFVALAALMLTHGGAFAADTVPAQIAPVAPHQVLVSPSAQRPPANNGQALPPGFVGKAPPFNLSHKFRIHIPSNVHFEIDLDRGWNTSDRTADFWVNTTTEDTQGVTNGAHMTYVPVSQASRDGCISGNYEDFPPWSRDEDDILWGCVRDNGGGLTLFKLSRIRGPSGDRTLWDAWTLDGQTWR